MEQEAEIWKDIEDYEGYYQISNLGRVKSLKRAKRRFDKVLQGSPNTTGYTIIQLRKDNKRVSKLVHRLVLEAFDPTNDPTLTVNHKDFDITNNKLTNLEWLTQHNNNMHYWDNADLGNRKDTPKGETHHLAVMTAEKVLEMRKLYSENIVTNKNALARMFGCSESTVRQILCRQSWKDI